MEIVALPDRADTLVPVVMQVPAVIMAVVAIEAVIMAVVVIVAAIMEEVIITAQAIGVVEAIGDTVVVTFIMVVFTVAYITRALVLA